VTAPTSLAGTVPPVRLAVVLVGVVACLAAAAGIGVRATYGAQTTADEPHYLLTAISLAEDGDLDVSDELADERYRPFHEAGLPVQERVLADGRQLAPHDPLLPVLLAVPWAVGGWVGAKAALALLAGVLAALTTWTAVRRFAVPPRTAALVVAGLSLAWPLSGYGTQVYPELPAALATVATVAVARAPGPPRTRRVLGLVLLVSSLPWLAVKYVPVAAALGGVLAWRWWRDGHRRALVATGTLLAVAGLAYLGLHHAWYGGWTVYAAADHFVGRGEFAVVGFAPDLPGRARRLVGLLVDRDFGLAAWQPLWLLAVPALAVWVRRRPAGWAWVAVPLAAGWLNATFVALTMQGWWLPGRQVVVVLPLAGIALAWWLGRAARAWSVAALALGAVGVVGYAWLVVDGLRERLTWVVDFASVGDPTYAVRRAVMPDYLQVSPATWSWQGLWLALLAALAWLAVRGDRAEDVHGVDGPSASPRPARRSSAVGG
jgi:hypothetical protein